MKPIRSVLVLGLVALATGCSHHSLVRRNSSEAAGGMPAPGQTGMGMGTGPTLATPPSLTPASTMPSPVATAPSLSPAPIPGP